MAALKFKKVAALPVDKDANTVYFLVSNTLLVLYLTDKNGQVIYHTADSTNIASVVNTLISNLINQPGGIAGIDLDGYISSDLIRRPFDADTLQGASVQDIINLVPGISNNIISRNSGFIAMLSGNTRIPYDNTVPLINEGTQLMSVSIVPNSTLSKFRFSITGIADCSSASGYITVSLFRDTSHIYHATQRGYGSTFSIDFTDSPDTASPVTYSCRIGVSNTAYTWYLGRMYSQSQGENTTQWYLEESLS